MKPRLLLVLSH